MTNTQIAEAFAQGKTTGTANSIFINGDTIFSYGYHFPIARLTDRTDETGKTIALFTCRSYSNTTAKHKNHVYSALSNAGYRIIVTDISEGKVSSNTIEGLKKELEEIKLKQTRARVEWSKENLLSQGVTKIQDIATLRTAYSL